MKVVLLSQPAATRHYAMYGHDQGCEKHYVYALLESRQHILGKKLKCSPVLSKTFASKLLLDFL